MRWGLVALLLLAGCRRVPAADTTASTLEVSNLTVSFPREEQGDLFFEVLLPRQVARITTLRWELFIGPRRFAEGVVMAPDITRASKRRSSTGTSGGVRAVRGSTSASRATCSRSAPTRVDVWGFASGSRCW